MKQFIMEGMEVQIVTDSAHCFSIENQKFSGMEGQILKCKLDRTGKAWFLIRFGAEMAVFSNRYVRITDSYLNKMFL